MVMLHPDIQSPEQIFATFHQHLPAPAGFLVGRQKSLAHLAALLYRAGDVERNPGPTYFCGGCGRTVGSGSIQCVACESWWHFGMRCAGIRYSKDRVPENWMCQSCMASDEEAWASLVIEHPLGQKAGFNGALRNLNDLNILQLNINGISSKHNELINFLGGRDIDVGILQETKLSGDPPAFDGYTVFHQNRQYGRGGGLITIVRNCLAASRLPDIDLGNNQIELLGVSISLPNKKNLAIFNIYVPPTASMVGNRNVSIEQLLNFDGDCLILGDINAHNGLWDGKLEDARGDAIADEIDAAGTMVVLNEPDIPTRLPVVGNATSPDISIASDAVARFATWSTEVTLGSDHLPIIINIRLERPVLRHARRTFVNFRRARWADFSRYVEYRVNRLRPPSSAHKAERIFRKILLRATRRFIPCGRHRMDTPAIPTELRRLIRERDELRAVDPAADRLRGLNMDIESGFRKHTDDRFKTLMESCSSRHKPVQYWSIVKSISGKQNAAKNISIDFGNGPISSHTEIAQNFNRLFGTVVPHGVTKERKKATWKLTSQLPLDDGPVFTGEDVRRAILDMNSSKATGPDGLTILQYQRLGPCALNYLAKIYNLTLSTCSVPAIWKMSHIIPLSKPGKDESLGSSYRPISLLCPAVKILEKLILPSLQQHLPLADHQHGFRRGRSTTTALMKLVDAAGNGFNRRLPPDRTVVAALDLTKAFDSLDHSLLIEKIAATTLPGCLVRFLANYLHGRQIRTLYRGKLSKARIIKVGSPQGSIISPHLFNFYISSIPLPNHPIKLVSYADDLTVFGTGKLDTIQDEMNAYIPELIGHLESIHLRVSAAKSTVTLLTSETQQANPAKMRRLLRVGDGANDFPVEPHPKILGVTFDPLLKFHRHAEMVRNRVKRNNNVLKCLGSNRIGQQKETLLTTYKALGRSIMDYAAPVWSTNLCNAQFVRLQAAQNAGLRVALGCHKMASEDHLHIESKMLKVREHCDLVAAQFLAQCYDVNFVCNELANLPDAVEFPRDKFVGLTIKHRELVEGRKTWDPGGPPGPADLKRTKAAIHTHIVNLSVQGREVNRVLQRPAPPICLKERRLDRQMRSWLSQLRSGFCCRLNYYRHRIEPNIADTCPLCHGSPHDTQHLFNCHHRRTALTVESLWNAPIPAARFVKNILKDADAL